MGSKKSGMQKPYSKNLPHSREILKKARLAKGYTQLYVANQCYISRCLYTKIETGLQNTSEDVWDKLELIFGIPKEKLKEKS